MKVGLQKPKVVTFRLSPEEHQKLVRIAEENKLTISDYIRERLFD